MAGNMEKSKGEDKELMDLAENTTSVSNSLTWPGYTLLLFPGCCQLSECSCPVPWQEALVMVLLMFT